MSSLFRFQVEAPAGKFFVVGAVHALDAVEEAAEGDFRFHLEYVIIGQHFEMRPPCFLEVDVENVAF